MYGIQYILYVSVLLYFRCQRNVANNCGVDAKQMAAILATMGISGDKLSVRSKKKV